MVDPRRSTISIFSLILTSNFTQLSSIRLFFPCSFCTWPKNHANILYIEHACACVHVPSKCHAHNNRPRLFQLLHTVSAQYAGQVPSMVKNEGLWLSAHGRLPRTLQYIIYYVARIPSHSIELPSMCWSNIHQAVVLHLEMWSIRELCLHGDVTHMYMYVAQIDP